MPRKGPRDGIPTWTPNQVVAANLARLRQRRGWTQAETARQLSEVSPKPWSEATVAHAERSVTGNRIREFTADDLVAMARAFDVPALYFLTPPPKLFVSVPDSPTYGIHGAKMLEAVLGRPDNLAEWETLIDEWTVVPEDEVPFPLDAARRDQIKATAQEIALIRAHHLVRRYFEGIDLLQLRETLLGLADLTLAVEQHEALTEIDEDEYVARIERNRSTTSKGARLTRAHNASQKQGAPDTGEAGPPSSKQA
jgi:transcriptional regulator with XRE-family HTH domain